MELPVQKIALLLADDSVTIRKVVELTLPHDRFVVSSFGDGEAALEAARLNKPDVLLADVVMPKIDGYRLCSAFREDPLLQDIPVILMVGTFEKFDEEQGRQAGADDYIIKPFEAQSLIGKIDAAIRNRAAASIVAPLPLSEEESSEIAELAGLDSEPSLEMPPDTLESPAVAEVLPEIEDVITGPPASEPPVAMLEETEPTTVTEGDESFPWEEDLTLPDEVPAESPAPAVAEVAIDEPASNEADNVFSLSDFNETAFTEALSSVLAGAEAASLSTEPMEPAPVIEEAPEEAIEEVEPEEAPVLPEESFAEESLPEESLPEEPAFAEVAPESASASSEAIAEAEAQPLVSATAVPLTGGFTPAPEESALEEAVSEQPRRSSSALSPELESAISECVKRSVQEAFAQALAALFRDAVEKAASEVVPALVEKAVKAEFEKHED